MANYQPSPRFPNQSAVKSGTASPGKGIEGPGGDSEDSIATILTHRERCDLIALIEAITTSIRNFHIAAFKLPAKPITEGTADLLVDFNQTNVPKPEQDARSKSNGMGSSNLEHEPTAQRQQDALSPKMSMLRRDIVRWIDQWREGVLSRVAEAMKTRWEPMEQSHVPSTPRVQQQEIHRDEISWDDDAWDDPPPYSTEPDSTYQAEVSLLHNLYPPIPNALIAFDKKKRTLILHSVLLLLLSLEHYHAPSRTLLLRLASSLNLTIGTLDDDESTTASFLLKSAKELSAAAEIQKKADENQNSRMWKVFGASVAGAALIGITGGLAAPLVAAGIGSILGGIGLGAVGGLLGSVAGSTVLISSLFGAYGGRMSGRIMEKYAREVADFYFWPLRHSVRIKGTSREEGDVAAINASDRRLRVTICISGWLGEEKYESSKQRTDVMEPWRIVGTSTEVFALRWEQEVLIELGNGLSTMVSDAAWSYAQVEILRHTFLASLLSAVIWPVGLMKIANFVDNPFSVAKSRAEKAGEVMADALINRAQGERPVNLLGYSIGARVIYSCLMSLARRRAFGLIDNVILFGAPIPASASNWCVMRSVVSGRLVNIFSKTDFVLGFLYRTSSLQFGVAGLQEVQGVGGVENLDVSDIVSGHLQYPYVLGRILDKIGWEDLDKEKVVMQEEALKVLERQEQKAKEAKQAAEERKVDAERRKTGELEAMEVARAAKERQLKGDVKTAQGADQLNYREIPTRINNSPSYDSGQHSTKALSPNRTLSNDTIPHSLNSLPSLRTGVPSKESGLSTQLLSENLQKEPVFLTSSTQINGSLNPTVLPTRSAAPFDATPPAYNTPLEGDNNNSDESDDEPEFRGIVMVDND